MLERAVDAKVPFAWFTGDEAYGQNRALREWCEERDIHYVLATRKDHEVASGLHTTTRADELIAKVRAGAWRRMSCGDGAHGPRVYDWVSVPIRVTFAHGRRGWGLARRSISPVSWPTTCVSARVASAAHARGHGGREVGGRGVVPDREERGRPGPVSVPSLRRLVRPYHPVHGRRRVPDHHPRPRSGKGGTTGDSDQDSLISLTVKEIRHLFASLILTAKNTTRHTLAWSNFRRRCNHRARAAHYRKRLSTLGSYEPP